jgi:hypothetical protein
MPNFYVTWQVEVEAESPVQAAQNALELMRDTRQPVATELDVIERENGKDRDRCADYRSNVGIISPRLRPAVKTSPTSSVAYLRPVEAQLFRSILEEKFRWLDTFSTSKPGDPEELRDRSVATLSELHTALKHTALKARES